MELSEMRTRLSVPSLEDSKTNSARQDPDRRVSRRMRPSSSRRIPLEMAMAKLFFVNIPYNCSDRELQEWVESRGVETRSIRIVRDLVAGVSPAFGYVELKDESRMQEAISILNGKKLRSQTILVKEAQTPALGAAYSERKSA
jgi:RNA recognition motif-containing protein